MGAVATSQIVKVLAHWVPPGVSGLLPSRGASDCAYSVQFELELAAKIRNRCSGIVMDLKKCLSNIRWICGYKFPQRNWSAHWNFSCVDPFDCQHLSILGDSRRIYFLAGTSTGGFPEGDSWSVVVIVALATAWVCYLVNTIPARSQPCLSAYADNWSWTLQEVIGHQVAMTNDMPFHTNGWT